MVPTRVLFLVLGLFCVECAVLSGRALFCRDPDSGKLHAINTTWASTSFCGNYTCKLRRRNITQMEFVPLRTFNVTNLRELDKNTYSNATSNNTTIIFETRAQNEITPMIHKNIPNGDNADIKKEQTPSHLKNEVASGVKIDTLNKIQKYDSHRDKNIYVKLNRNNDAKPQFIETVSSTSTNIQSDSPIKYDNPDRYLTENEIKTISDMLHTVKKSDLDALVDIYNLAQEIYNEMDKTTNENLIDETINEIKIEQIRKRKPTSYWYEPFANKGGVSNRLDMDYQGTDSVISTTKTQDYPSYYSGVPFYYPVAGFQTVTSYVQVPIKNTEPTKINDKNEIKPCNKEYIKTKRPYNNEDRLIRPSYLLPYPFSNINNYNISDIPRFYYNYPWKYNYYNSYRYYQPYYNGFIAPIPTAQSEEVQGFEQESIETYKLNSNTDTIQKPNKKKPEELDKPKFEPAWKTPPLSNDVLENMRAKVDTSKLIKALPLRKLVKVDRVVKVGKGPEDEDLLRKKREVESSTEVITGDNDDYETYVEKITCKPETVPGFFRFGNMTEPFPRCCPQLILDKDKL